MKSKDKNKENEKEENELNDFYNLTLYTDRIVELINNNIIDYTCKSLNIIYL